jgi:DNA polymerase
MNITAEQINTLTRACLCASPGRMLAVVDYSQVEARANAWMAGDTAAVERFRKNIDPYIALAARLFGVPPDSIDKKDPRRKIGKAAELACGYGQGPGGPHNPRKGKDYGKPYGFYGYGLKSGVNWERMAQATPAMTPKIVVDGWRELHSPIVKLWKDLERGFLMAYAGRDSVVGVGCQVQFSKWNHCVVCELPSGRPLVYHDVHVSRGEYGPSPSYMGGKGREHTYGGKLCENVIQAICRDFLAIALVQAEDEGLDPVLHVHDEIVCDVPASLAGACLHRLEQTMCDLPPWGEGMPIAAEGFLCERYRK